MNLFDAAEERDQALAQVAVNSGDWFNLAKMQFRLLAESPTFRLKYPEIPSDKIKTWLIPYVGKPHHENAWGAVVKSLVKEGVIEFLRFENTTSLGRKASIGRIYTWL